MQVQRNLALLLGARAMTTSTMPAASLSSRLARSYAQRRLVGRDAERWEQQLASGHVHGFDNPWDAVTGDAGAHRVDRDAAGTFHSPWALLRRSGVGGGLPKTSGFQ